jgi:hypothetical protein
LEYLVKEYERDELGVTQPNEYQPSAIRVVWESGISSYPWWERVEVYNRYQVLREVTDAEAQKYLLVWKVKGTNFGKLL